MIVRSKEGARLYLPYHFQSNMAVEMIMKLLKERPDLEIMYLDTEHSIEDTYAEVLKAVKDANKEDDNEKSYKLSEYLK